MDEAADENDVASHKLNAVVKVGDLAFHLDLLVFSRVYLCSRIVYALRSNTSSLFCLIYQIRTRRTHPEMYHIGIFFTSADFFSRERDDCCFVAD